MKGPENRHGTGGGAWELIQAAHRLGLALRVEDGRLLASPADRLPADLRAALAAHAGGVAVLLRVRACRRCGSTGWRMALVTDEGRHGCNECLKSKVRRVGTVTRAVGGAA